MNIPEMPFSAHVDVILPNGLQHSFHSVYDALDFLENEWPLKHGTYHERAISRCRRALQELVSVDTAREVFVDACLEAGMPPTGSDAGVVPPRIDINRFSRELVAATPVRSCDAIFSGGLANAHDNAKMNIFLHKALMKKLAENGGKVPADPLD